MEYVNVTKDNIEKEHICCAISNNNDIQVSSKKAWMSERFEDGLVFLKSTERGKCFIEYIPAEKAWNPILADGYMYKRTDTLYRFGIKVKSTDDNIIKKFCNYINYPLDKITYRDQERNGNISKVVEIQINDQDFCNYLINLGVVPKKSGKEIMPNCNGYEIDFIRGFIDGDGWVYRHLCATGQDRFVIGCCSTSLEILNSIKTYIKESLDIDMHISEQKGVYKCENASKYKVFKLLNRIYYDNCLSLDRKNNLAQEIKKEIYNELF